MLDNINRICFKYFYFDIKLRRFKKKSNFLPISSIRKIHKTLIKLGIKRYGDYLLERNRRTLQKDLLE